MTAFQSFVTRIYLLLARAREPIDEQTVPPAPSLADIPREKRRGIGPSDRRNDLIRPESSGDRAEARL